MLNMIKEFSDRPPTDDYINVNCKVFALQLFMLLLQTYTVDQCVVLHADIIGMFTRLAHKKESYKV